MSQQVGANVTEKELNDLIVKTQGVTLDELLTAQVGMNVAEYKTYLKNQLIDYNSYFTDAFTGGSKGAIISEGLSIFYSKDKYYLHEQGFIRLNDKFGFETKNWRICQWMKLATKRVYNKPYTYEEIYVFNTHLDHKDREARRIGLEKILAKIEEIKQFKNYLPTKSKFFICGDFNMEISWYDWFKDFAKQFSFLLHTYFFCSVQLDTNILDEYQLLVTELLHQLHGDEHKKNHDLLYQEPL